MSVFELKHRVILLLTLVACLACQSPKAMAIDEKLQVEAGGEKADDAHAGEAQHDTSVPMEIQTDLALWSLITFLCFLFLMKKFAWSPMIEGLDKREQGIRKAIADAEDGRRKSQVLLAEYEQRLKVAEQTVQGMISEAERDAERTKQDMISSAKREVEAVRDRAKDDIRQAKDTALSEVFAQMNSQIVRATEHVLGRTLQDVDQERLVGEALAKIGS